MGTDRSTIIICIMLYETVSSRVPPLLCIAAPKRRPTTMLNTNVRQKKKDGTRQKRRDDDYESDKNENGERKSHGLTRRLKRTDRMTDEDGRETDGEIVRGRTRTGGEIVTDEILRGEIWCRSATMISTSLADASIAQGADIQRRSTPCDRLLFNLPKVLVDRQYYHKSSIN